MPNGGKFEVGPSSDRFGLRGAERERPLLIFVTVSNGHVAECHERFLTGIELGNRKAACRVRLLCVLTCRPPEKLPGTQARDSLRHIAEIRLSELPPPYRSVKTVTPQSFHVTVTELHKKAVKHHRYASLFLDPGPANRSNLYRV